MKNMIDILIDKIKETGNPTVMGLDPRYEMLPKCVTEKYPKTLEGVAQAILEYNKELIDATYDIIPAVKPQIAFYEMFGIPGMQAFEEYIYHLHDIMYNLYNEMTIIILKSFFYDGQVLECL